LPRTRASERRVFSWVLKAARELAGSRVDHVWIYSRPDTGLDPDLRSFSIPQAPSGNDQGLPGRVSRTGVPIVCQDVHRHESFSASYLPVFPETTAQWCFPLLIQDFAAREELRPVLCLEAGAAIDPSLRPAIDVISRLGGLKISALRGMRKLDRVQTLKDDLEIWRLKQQIQELSGIRPEGTIRKLFDSLVEVLGCVGMALWQYDEAEDNFCHPFYSSRTPLIHRTYPPPGPWGPIGRVVGSGQPRFCPLVSEAPDLVVSRFMTEQKILATAYIPGCIVEEPVEGKQDSARKVKGILFVNFDEEHWFSPLEKRVLRYAADAAVEILRLRSEARRHRLAERFDLDFVSAYPGGSPILGPAAKAVIAAFSVHLGRPHGVLYVRDRPGSLFIRFETTSELGDSFRGRYLESNPFPRLLSESRTPRVMSGRELAEVVDAPAVLHQGHILALPLQHSGTLLGFCLLASEAPSAAMKPDDEVQLTLCQDALETLINLDRQTRSQRRYISLLGQFLRIYEYAATEISPVPLLTAFLDVLLEGSTADACYIFLRGEIGDSSDPAVARGDHHSSGALRIPLSFEQILEDGGPRFKEDPDPAETAAGDPDVRAQAILPLRFHSKLFGVLSVEYRVIHKFTAEDSWFFQVLAYQLGQSLQYFQGNLSLLEKVNSLAASGARIAQLGSPEFKEDVPVTDESRRLVIQAKNLSRADFVDLYVRHGDLFVLEATEGGTGDQSRVGRDMWKPDLGIVSRVCREQRSLNLPDVQTETSRELGYVVNPAFPDAVSELVVPVVDDDEVVAIIDLNARRAGAFTQGDSYFVQAIAAQAVALRRAAELQQTRRRLDRERDLLVQINRIAQSAVEEGEMAVLRRILETMARYLEAHFISIHMLAQDGYSFDPARSLAIPEAPELLRGLTVDNSILGFSVKEARESGEAYRLIDDAGHPPAGWPASRRHGKGEPMGRLVVFLGQREDIVGVINIEHREHEALRRQVNLVLAVVQGIHNALALADLANRRASEHIRQRIAQETDEFVQLLTSTVFHDAPQVVEGLRLRLSQLEEIYSSDAMHLMAPQASVKWAEIRSTLERLKRLSTTLPRDTQPNRIDLTDIVRRTFERSALVALSYFEELCRVEIEAPSVPLYIYESSDWLMHILENLATNSFREMSRSGTPEPRLVVRVFTSVDGKLGIVQVDDNGPGLKPDITDKIGMERIQNADRPEQLGIFHQVARNHVQRRGGELVPGDSLLGGCLFELRYPLFTG